MGFDFCLALFLFFLGFLLGLAFLPFATQFLAEADELGGFGCGLDNGLRRRGHDDRCGLWHGNRLLLNLDERSSQLADFLDNGLKRVFLGRLLNNGLHDGRGSGRLDVDNRLGRDFLSQGNVQESIGQRLVAIDHRHDNDRERDDDHHEQENEENAQTQHALTSLGLFGVNVFLKGFQDRKIVRAAALAENADGVRLRRGFLWFSNFWIHLYFLVTAILSISFAVRKDNRQNAPNASYVN